MAEVSSSDYRDFLRQRLVERGLRQKDLASLVDRSCAWVSQMLAGKRPLRPAIARRVGEALAMSKREQLRLQAMVECETSSGEILESRTNRSSRGYDRRTEPALVADSSNPAVLASWKANAVYQLAQCDNYLPDPAWVAATVRPRMSVPEASEALALLRERGMLDADNRIPESATPAVDRCEVRDATALGAYHRDTLDLAKRALEALPENERTFLASCVALSEEDYEWFSEQLQALVAHVLRMASRSKPNRVYHVNLAAFPISLFTDSWADPRTVSD